MQALVGRVGNARPGRLAGTAPSMAEAAEQSDASAARGEAGSVLAVLERNRRTFAWKKSGLDEAGLRATTAASAMTLGGLVMHLALVEADWLAVKLAGQGYGPPLGCGGLRCRS